METEWELLEDVFGMPQAELLRSYLEALGIPVVLSQEGYGHVLALTVGPLGRVQVMVPVEKLDAARQAVAAMLPGVPPAEEAVPADEEADASSEPPDTPGEPLP